MVLLGIGLLLWGQSRSFGSIQRALVPDKDTILVDALRAKSRLNRGPNIVAIGGGTGLSTLLSGLKRYSSHITAIVTVADDGGSSGVLRRELGVLPPGDIRNCLAALSTEEPLLTRLFQYRFSAGSGLEGHSFGNLFLSALTAITGNLETAITASSRVLAVQGQVVPATNVDVRLWAELENGDRIEGESNIGKAPSPIVRLGCLPERPPALPRALEAIANADLILLGPGSLYTSLLPNLLVPELVSAIQASRAPRLYICNLMTQPGETDGLDVSGHLRAIEAQLASIGISRRLFTAVLAQDDLGSSPLVDHYRSRGADPVICNLDSLRQDGYDVMQAPLQGARPTATLRHDPRSLALAVMRFTESIVAMRAVGISRRPEARRSPVGCNPCAEAIPSSLPASGGALDVDDPRTGCRTCRTSHVPASPHHGTIHKWKEGLVCLLGRGTPSDELRGA